ncbi:MULTISPECIES: pseudouridine-5'-phosphate glycosidase [unclassified Ruegeria]|uniref:pseudouridine-5'-phosphate glycosidase n=1 Tax=unclassified Ruegeria TaxID=2625375 RepID=UPI0014890D6F|nr:pseudouridine-5-phosphate glycosidase [Ruegeria sp. HKCCD4332]NOD87546.1 pseudouridine-5-phosphate glycosidase [Ruegeria sp. HKCCD4318]NOE15579.1 pseudouridine-5-phosphate glycosidase [Ruegeria sp. HKCCD4318-2]NOG08731.1 pseudouridine-5'-phosphate glycosidase [Ruegeria sp. HKCCD4315]
MIEIQYSAEVRAAKDAGQPIVALESTIITHGMPYPQNVEVAAQVEQDIRDAGAVPATMAVIAGKLHVGLEPEQLQWLGQAQGVAKISRADMAACISTGGTGATTVAATMIAAQYAGIEVFATGGIGGVHQGAETTFDISADLHELGHTPVTVVAAGAKAILDLAKTLEVLETLGVPVIAYRQDEFPAFWSAKSPFSAPLRMDSAEAIAKAHATRRVLGLPGGQLVANPIPAADQIAAGELAPIIAEAQADADAHRITGKAVTPYLLQRIFEKTEGRSLTANIALVRNNARLAAKIAQSLVQQG